VAGSGRRPPASGDGEFTESVVRTLRRVRAGEVVTYGEVAEESGFPGAARAVGGVLATVDGLPWWRVVTSTGRLVPGHEAEQARRLGTEGVEVVDGRVGRGAITGKASSRRRGRPAL
jgi:methylated-DNA-protein-cysteine methyltransferase related protein